MSIEIIPVETSKGTRYQVVVNDYNLSFDFPTLIQAVCEANEILKRV